MNGVRHFKSGICLERQNQLGRVVSHLADRGADFVKLGLASNDIRLAGNRIQQVLIALDVRVNPRLE